MNHIKSKVQTSFEISKTKLKTHNLLYDQLLNQTKYQIRSTNMFLIWDMKLIT